MHGSGSSIGETQSTLCAPMLTPHMWPGKVVDMPSERVDGMFRNQWTASVGINGRHGPDYVKVSRFLPISSTPLFISAYWISLALTSLNTEYPAT
jgi:hypothetical protein